MNPDLAAQAEALAQQFLDWYSQHAGEDADRELTNRVRELIMLTTDGPPRYTDRTGHPITPAIEYDAEALADQIALQLSGVDFGERAKWILPVILDFLKRVQAETQQELQHWRSSAEDHGHPDAHSWSLSTDELKTALTTARRDALREAAEALCDVREIASQDLAVTHRGIVYKWLRQRAEDGQ